MMPRLPAVIPCSDCNSRNTIAWRHPREIDGVIYRRRRCLDDQTTYLTVERAVTGPELIALAQEMAP
jgi:transcriptional regulator NrdR family protein